MSKWIYKPENLTLYNQETGYEVDLESMVTSAEVLDWIFQIADKEGEEWDIAGFISILEETISHHFGNSAQGVFCPSGRSMKVDWQSKTYKEIR